MALGFIGKTASNALLLDDLIEILNKILENKTYLDIATSINVAIGTVKRWNELKKVPESYTFELLKLANINIVYSNFSYKDKDQFFTPTETSKYCYSKFGNKTGHLYRGL